MAIGMKVYFVSSPAPSAAAKRASSSVMASYAMSVRPASGQSTSDQPAVMASAGVATIAAVARPLRFVRSHATIAVATAAAR